MLYIIVGLVLLAADIASKFFVVKNLMPIGSVEILQNILNFTYVENRGIAFGMFENGRIFFIIITLLILAVLFVMMKKLPEEKMTVWFKLGMSMVVSGAIGNLIERIWRGYVVDFIEVKFIDFPVFNIADIAVCVGAVMLLIHFLFFDTAKQSDKE